MKKLFIIAMSVLFVGTAYGGMNDRFSKIELTEKEQISIPATAVPAGTYRSVPKGDPEPGSVWVYVIDNYGELKPVSEDDRGNITVLGPKALDLPLADWTRVWTGSQTGIDNGIGWASQGSIWDYPYRTANVYSSAIVFPQYHPLDRISLLGPGAEAYQQVPTAWWHLDYTKNAAITPIQNTFRLPSNFRYISDGNGSNLSVNMIVHQDQGTRETNAWAATTTARVRIGYAFFHGTTWDGHDIRESSYTYDPVSVGTPGNQLSPVEVKLEYRPTTGSGLVADLFPGQLMTVWVWRIRDNDVVDNLRILKAQAQFTDAF